MNWIAKLLMLWCALAVCLATTAYGQSGRSGTKIIIYEDDDEEDEATPTTTSAPAERQLTPEEQNIPKEARDFYFNVEDLYMHGEWAKLTTSLQGQAKNISALSPQMRQNVQYMRTSAPEYRPGWWKNCRSSSNTSFAAKIWGRQFTANYVPSSMLGMQMPVDIVNGRFQIIVSWRPNFVDSPKPLKGIIAKKLKLTQGDLGEVVVWHELGHNYITNFLSAKQVINLYENQQMLFDHLQEFYADLTALYHCSPHGRLTTMVMRTEDIEEGQEGSIEEHHRASYAVGSLVLTAFLTDPSKWPSVHLPPKLPEKDAELNTVIYVYDHFDPNWTLTEDKALRDLIKKFIQANGDAVLRDKGVFTLPNKLKFGLVSSDDRDLAGKRDKWVEEQLDKAIQSGRADKAPPKSATTKKSKNSDDFFKRFFHRRRIEIPW